MSSQKKNSKKEEDVFDDLEWVRVKTKKKKTREKLGQRLLTGTKARALEKRSALDPTSGVT